MATPIAMPSLGMVMTEGTVARWLVPDGATVAKGEPVVEIESDKLTHQIEAPAAGVVCHAAAEGATLPVEGLIAWILAPGEEVPSAPAGAVAAASAAAPPRAPEPAPAQARSGGGTNASLSAPASRAASVSPPVWDEPLSLGWPPPSTPLGPRPTVLGNGPAATVARTPTEPLLAGNGAASPGRGSTAARAAVLAGIGGPFQVQELPVLPLRPGGALLRMTLSGVCATDAHIFKGDWPGFRFPAILGHENCARIESLGPGVETDFLGQPLAPGDLVIPRVASCGRCWYCLVGGASRWCPNRRPAPGVGGGLTLTGGWAEYMYLESDALQLFKTEAPPEVAVLTEPMATCVGAVDRAALKLGETVVVQGAGPIGLLTTACARLAGAGTLIVVGGPAARLELARALGADLTIDVDAVPDPSERTERVWAATPRGFGADLVLGCVGHPAAVGEGLGYLRPGNARMVEVGNATGSGSFPMRPSPHLVYKNATLHGFWGATTEHWIAALRVLERGALPFERVVSHRLPLARAGDAIAALNGDYLVDGRTAVKIAIDPWRMEDDRGS